MKVNVNINKHIYLSIIGFIVFFILTSLFMYLYAKATLQNYNYHDDDDVDFYEKRGFVMNMYETTLPQNQKQVIALIKSKINIINREQVVFNQNLFGPLKPDNFIIVIQVHNNVAFLNLLISTLSKAMGISSALLIFSHDVFDYSINDIISEIKFARYMQIFYPFNNQIYHSTFPGNDVKFCYDDFVCTKFCTNPKTCLRDHVLAQKKHFWWWHLIFIFERLKIAKEREEPIVFLEENQFVLEDILYLMKAVTDLVQKNVQYDVISFGSITPGELDINEYLVAESQLAIEPWDANDTSIAFAFNQTVWKSIRKNRNLFCRFEDHRWEASLSYLSFARVEGPFKVMKVSAPRVYPMYLCDGTKAGCSLKGSIDDMKYFAERIRRGLYPQTFNFVNSERRASSVTPLGGWKDVRDAELCVWLGKEFSDWN